jgi:hypothetical protein
MNRFAVGHPDVLPALATALNQTTDARLRGRAAEAPRTMSDSAGRYPGVLPGLIAARRQDEEED